MKLVRYKYCSQEGIGLVHGDLIVDVAGALKLLPLSDPDVKLALFPSDMVELVGEWDKWCGVLSTLVSELSSNKLDKSVVFDRKDITLLAPIGRPPKIICIGLNYASHARETNKALPTQPVFFSKFATAITGPDSDIVLPEVSSQVDYEAELAVIVGAKGKDISKDDAMSYVFGYTCFNDVSARDLQFADGQWIKGKTCDTFAPTGPWIVTRDEIANPHNLDIRLVLNGTVMQQSNTADLIFDIPTLISYLSSLFTLEPGDIIATGTPAGVGFARDPQVFLKSGDVTEVQIEGVGVLRNRVV